MTWLIRVAAWLRGRWWQLRRPVITGVRTVVLDDEGRVLLVRHSYGRDVWYLPGGGVKRRETLAEAAARELREEGGVEVVGGPAALRLHGTFTNLRPSSTDHVSVFVVHAGGWRATGESSIEIAERGFFPIGALPESTSPGTRRRLGELASGTPPSHTW